MNVREAKKILAVMMVSFQNYKPVNIDSTAQIWADMLYNYTYEQVAMALKAYIQTDTSGFAPAIGQIIARIQTITQPEQLNEMEAWALVSKALRNGYYGAEKEFNNLPSMVQQAVGCPDNLRHWSQSDLSSIETVVQSNFLRTYRIIVQREQEKQKMSVDLQNLIDAANCEKTFYIAESRPAAVVDDIGLSVPMPEKMKEKLKKELLSN